jgi:pimeloyl-ACP methyl ester carboxylesterase
MSISPPKTFRIPVGEGAAARDIAVAQRAGKAPGIFWLGGFRSDMAGSKAMALDALGAETGLAVTRFDYSGHGQTGGDFNLGTITRWLEESLAVFDTTSGQQIVIGSSMGGWLALLLGRALGPRLAGLVGIAAAPDFTDWGYGSEQKRRLAAGEILLGDNPYGPEPTPTHPGFWSDGQQRRVLGGEIAIDCPVRLLHGQDDSDVPPEISLRLARSLRSQDVQVTLVKGGDHRLSRDGDIALLLRTVAALS